MSYFGIHLFGTSYCSSIVEIFVTVNSDKLAFKEHSSCNNPEIDDSMISFTSNYCTVVITVAKRKKEKKKNMEH